MQRPDILPQARPGRDAAYTYAGIAGLLVMALHSMGLGVLDPGRVLNAQALAVALPRVWPYLALCAGVATRRRWARDLAAPVALLALVSALAVFPRYEFLDLGVARDPRYAGHVPHIWRLFRRQWGYQALHALLCAGDLYALTRPELVARCSRERAQPDWTVGLGFAALLLLGWEAFAAGQAVDRALYVLADRSSAAADAWAAAGLALLSLAALVGLWRRRPWGWFAALAQALVLLTRLLLASLGTASMAYDSAVDRAPSAAACLAGEAFCRSLPELAPLLCVLAALALAKRAVRAGRPGAAAAAPSGSAAGGAWSPRPPGASKHVG